jgi:hypothetical protein
MAREPLDSDDLHDPRIARRRTRRTGDAVSRLCSSWLQAGGDILVGSLGIANNVAEDLTEMYCERRPRRSDDD